MPYDCPLQGPSIATFSPAGRSCWIAVDKSWSSDQIVHCDISKLCINIIFWCRRNLWALMPLWDSGTGNQLFLREQQAELWEICGGWTRTWGAESSGLLVWVCFRTWFYAVCWNKGPKPGGYAHPVTAYWLIVYTALGWQGWGWSSICFLFQSALQPPHCFMFGD